MNKTTVEKIWTEVCQTLDEKEQNWKETIQSLGQTKAVEKRKNNTPFNDDQIFEGVLKSVLSNATDWSKIVSVLPELSGIFDNFSLEAYSQKSNPHVDDTLMPWFKSHKAGSMTLAKDLKNLITASRILHNWSMKNGSADAYFSTAITEGGDIIGAVKLLGTPDSGYKLPAMGIPIAAEAMKNLGYEVGKPDRHVCRALGCFGLVTYKNWKDRSSTKSPAATPSEQVETMRAMEKFSAIVNLSPTYVDNVLWLLCAKMGPHLSNAELENFKSNITGGF